MAACPTCAQTVGGDELFCEQCGTTLRQVTPQLPQTATTWTQTSTTCTCGGSFEAGWCDVCGSRQPRARDRFEEQPSQWVGAVCDRGIRHDRNEDGMASAADGTWCALVVCDGVTTATDSDLASLNAARAARDTLVERQQTGSDHTNRAEHWALALSAACTAATREAVAAATHVEPGLEPPSCTFVAAIAEGDLIVAGNVGDSRAYWLPDSSAAVQLGVDDSWAAEQIAMGAGREQAEADPRAHSITRWLGADGGTPAPTVHTATAAGDGWLLVCSDGLWNYQGDHNSLGDLVRQHAAACNSEPMATASSLVAWANSCGGHDNITVGLARVHSSTNTAPITH